MRDFRSEDGSTLLLTLFYTALALVLILVVVGATSLYLERKRLFTLADGASLVGAEAFSINQAAGSAPGWRPKLTSTQVAGAVRSYLRQNATGEFTALKVDRAVSVDGKSATVELSCYWRPPVLSLLLPRGFRISVTSIARSVFS
jgi:hypothetical protein